MSGIPYREQRRGLAGLLLLWSLSGCQAPAPGPSPSASPLQTPKHTASPVASATPSVSTEEKTLAEFESVTQRYEEKQGDSEPGYQTVEPLLNGKFPEVLGEELFSVSLETPEQRAAFDSEVLPVLRESFGKPHFLKAEKLVASEVAVNYRGLRVWVGLLAERAEQCWAEEERERALELAVSPLALAHSMDQRPQTVSRNLFSSSYATSGILLLSEWAEQLQGDPKLLAQASEKLTEYAPRFEHVEETITVDFAQLWNSLQDEDGRKGLGIGQVQDSTLERWRKQVLSIYSVAEKLYEFQPDVVDSLNGELRGADGPIQGVVIDYPQVVSMQLHAFAQYKATELGYRLLSEPELRETPPEQVLERAFASSPDSAKALAKLLVLETDDKQIKISAQPGRFELLAPGEPPVFFRVALADSKLDTKPQE